MFMGQIRDPEGGTDQTNLPAARQLVDILSMLSDKTRGNLEAEEQKLLDQLLFDLRTKYIEISKS